MGKPVTAPRQGTKVAALFGAIKGKGSARTAELAEATGVDSGAVSALLQPYVKKGVLVVCEVMVGGRLMHEYRFCASINPRTFNPEDADAIGVRPAPAPLSVSPRPPLRPAAPAPAPAPAARPAPVVTNVSVVAQAAALPRLETAWRAPAEKVIETAPAPTPASAPGSTSLTTPRPAPAPAPSKPQATAATRFGMWSDGTMVIETPEATIVLPEPDTRRFLHFIDTCLSRSDAP